MKPRKNAGNYGRISSFRGHESVTE